MYEEVLETCPLCGSCDVHSTIIAGKEGKYVYDVECANCACSTGVYEKAQDAIEAWNNRFEKEGYALLPCPLCGGMAEVGHYGSFGEEIDTELYAIRCSICHFSTCNTTEDTLDTVIADWNRRA